MTDRPTPSPLLRTVGLLVLFTVVGAGAGLVWELLWTPPRGVVFEGRWFLESDGLQDDVSGTGWFVVVGLAAGLLLGLAAALTARGSELATAVAVVFGSALATVSMLLLGQAAGPADPAVRAASAEDRTEIPAELTVVGVSPYLVLPTGALLSLAVVYFAVPGRPEPDRD